MKRYALFGGLDYYPLGGWSDFRGSFYSLNEALEYWATNPLGDWYQIVDLTTGEIVSETK